MIWTTCIKPGFIVALVACLLLPGCVSQQTVVIIVTATALPQPLPTDTAAFTPTVTDGLPSQTPVAPTLTATAVPRPELYDWALGQPVAIEKPDGVVLRERAESNAPLIGGVIANHTTVIINGKPLSREDRWWWPVRTTDNQKSGWVEQAYLIELAGQPVPSQAMTGTSLPTANPTNRPANPTTVPVFPTRTPTPELPKPPTATHPPQPSDRDGDGFPDDSDLCPDEWGRFRGCMPKIIEITPPSLIPVTIVIEPELPVSPIAIVTRSVFIAGVSTDSPIETAESIK